MRRFWIVHDIKGERVVRVQDADALIFARLDAMIDGFGGDFVEAHPLDDKLASRIPRRLINRTLSSAEAGGCSSGSPDTVL